MFLIKESGHNTLLSSFWDFKHTQSISQEWFTNFLNLASKPEILLGKVENENVKYLDT